MEQPWLPEAQSALELDTKVVNIPEGTVGISLGFDKSAAALKLKI